MRFAAFVLLALSAAFMLQTACEAQPSAQPQTGPAASAPVSPAPQTGSQPAPAPAHHSRSPKKAAPAAAAAPAPAPASKPDSGTPDVVVGGLPGVRSAAPIEKQP